MDLKDIYYLFVFIRFIFVYNRKANKIKDT